VRVSPNPAVTLVVSWCDLTLDALGKTREEIDALNVYPVPDGDTGTNVYLTFESARQAILDCQNPGLVEALNQFGRGALLGARGNSGVILSQMLRAGAEQLLRGNPLEPGRLLADTLTLAAEGAYAAVAEPVEGTILTVARAAAEAAQSAVADLPDDLTRQMGVVIEAAAVAAREALDRTPEQLETLRNAGVVDAGGRALCVIIDAAQLALTGKAPLAYNSRPTAVHKAVLVNPGGDLSADGPGYEVMYLLDADDAAVPQLRKQLAGLGDSLVVVGGDGLWNIHVHVDDVGAAIEAGIEAGRPHRVRVTHFAEQIDRARQGRPPSTRVVIAIAAGPGLQALFDEAGAVALLGGSGRRRSTGEILDAINTSGAGEVVVIPNDGDSIAVAEAAAQAARDDGIITAVIPTRAQVQGLAALAVHDATRPFGEDVVAMTAAAGHARHGAVTIAARDAMTMAGACQAGDVLGVVDGDFAVIGDDLATVAVQVVERLLSGGGEMVTLVRGEGGDDELCAAVENAVTATRPALDVLTYTGGQARYPLLIGVE
jgi:DAK2 domain fusion protein YloV